MLNIKNLETVKRNCERFWNKEFIGRPYICVSAPKDNAEPVWNDFTYVKQIEGARSGDFLRFAENYLKIAENTFYGGEALPNFCFDFGPDQYAAFYGGEIVGQTGQYTTWVHKIADETAALDCRFNPDNKYFKMMLEMLRRVTEFAGDRYLVSMLDLHSNLDTLSALLGPENLCCELLDNPNIVEKKLNELNDAYPLIYDALYKAGGMDRRGTIGWQPMYSAKKSAVVQCDFSCMISPEMARKYLIPSIERETDFLDHSVYHYDGKGALGHLNDILGIKKLNCIQWVPGDGEKRTVYWMDLLKTIQKSGKSVWLYDWTKDEILADKELDPALTMFSLWLPSESESHRFIEDLERKYK